MSFVSIFVFLSVVLKSYIDIEQNIPYYLYVIVIKFNCHPLDNALSHTTKRTLAYTTKRTLAYTTKRTLAYTLSVIDLH